MYFYITTRLKQGYKVGITNDVEKRQQQYTTLIPNINFYLYIQTPYAEEIENHLSINLMTIELLIERHQKR